MRNSWSVSKRLILLNVFNKSLIHSTWPSIHCLRGLLRAMTLIGTSSSMLSQCVEDFEVTAETACSSHSTQQLHTTTQQQLSTTELPTTTTTRNSKCHQPSPQQRLHAAATATTAADTSSILQHTLFTSAMYLCHCSATC